MKGITLTPATEHMLIKVTKRIPYPHTKKILQEGDKLAAWWMNSVPISVSALKISMYYYCILEMTSAIILFAMSFANITALYFYPQK
jgi:hypothetical protein